ncbi:putative cuticle collagen 145 isoform X2 [Onychostruthus taczanowskii]|uniref:putative cuticle collagen 145 isoform X2 n=1 Tax=Onychostruthus taczanowskii TaxID=356909 RepID=UPI001B80BE29|nr:putative cuticle collagen 145 isoform X2 [Onychostruthus taczanowskii]
MAEREGEKPRERGFANQRGSAQKLGTPLGDGCVRGQAAAVCPLHIPAQPGRGAPNIPRAGGQGTPPSPCTHRGALSGLSREELSHSVPAEAGPGQPGSGHGQRGGCAGPGRVPGLLSGSWHCPSPGLARKHRLSLRGRTELSPDHPSHPPRPAAPGHSGKTRTPVNLQSQTAPPVEAETPAKRCASFPVPGEPLAAGGRAPAGPGRRCGIPGRAALTPAVPACHRHLPAGPAAPEPGRCRAARPGLRHRPLGPARFAPFPQKCRAAPREFRFVGAGELPLAGSLCCLPGWEETGGGDAGSISADPRAETEIKIWGNVFSGRRGGIKSVSNTGWETKSTPSCTGFRAFPVTGNFLFLTL